MVTVDSQCARAAVNHRAWLEVSHCLEPSETIQAHILKEREGLVTSAPDPLALCGVGTGGVSTTHFQEDNARVFTCISDVVRWCDSSFPPSESAPPPDSATPPELVTAERVQVLVTGSLHLVGATMSVLGCRVQDL